MDYTHEDKEALRNAMLDECIERQKLFWSDPIDYAIWGQLWNYLSDQWWKGLCDRYLEEFEIGEYDLVPHHPMSKVYTEFLDGMFAQKFHDYLSNQSFDKYVNDRL